MMSKPTFFSLFTGGDLAGTGAAMAGCEIIGGVEYDAAIADVARANGCENIAVAPVETTDPRKTCPQSPDILWASPVCKSFSVAKAGGCELDADRKTAETVCDYIRVLRPRIFFLENVQGYMKSESFARVRAALDSMGYFSHASVLNAADYNVPQTRRRLILRASRDGFLPQLPHPTRWRGWYEAIEDLIPTLPESQFAQWQLDRLADGLLQTSIVEGDVAGPRPPTYRNSDSPVFTLKANAGEQRRNDIRAFLVGEDSKCGRVAATSPAFTMVSSPRAMSTRAFIVDGKPKNYAGDLQITEGGNPIVTLTASQPRHPLRAWLSQGRVVKMTPRALARFQSVPDEYVLPEKNALACTVIGNGVPCELSRRLIEQFLN